MHLEGGEGVLVVRRDEDDGRHPRRPDLPHHFEPVELGHLNVEQHDVGLELANHAHGRAAIAALPDDDDLRMLAEQRAHARARMRLVVGDEHAKRVGHAVASRAACRVGLGR